MYIRCPSCNTVFRLHVSQLKAGHGKVRCGNCKTIFLAQEHTYKKGEEPPEPATAQQQNLFDESAQATAEPYVTQPADEIHEAGQSAVEKTSTNDTAPAYSIPVELEKAPTRTPFTLGRVMLSLLLCTTLLVQLMYWQRNRLVEYPKLQPALKLMCQYAACELPLVRRPKQVTLRDHKMQDHPQYPNTLLVTATIANHTGMTIAYPTLELRLLNTHGETVGARYFSYQEYLVAKLEHDGFRNATRAQVQLELVDPGRDVVGFEIDFH